MSLTGTIVVSGGAGGIGSEFVSHFLRTPQGSLLYGVYLVHPSDPTDKLERSLLLDGSQGHQHEIVKLDLAQLHSIREFTASINNRVSAGKLPPVRALALIAGGIFQSSTPEGVDYTDNGYEKSFAVNFLANCLLSLSLLHSLDTKDGARIIYMASILHNPSFPSNMLTYTAKDKKQGVYRDLRIIAKGRQEVEGRSSFETTIARYGTSKMLLIMFMYELQRRLSENRRYQNISVLGMDPAAVAGTAISRSFPWHLWILLQYIMIPIQWIWTCIFLNGIFRTAAKVGKDLVFACFDEKTLGKTPKAVYLNGTEIADSSPETHDEAKQRRLWDEICGMLEIKELDL